MFHIYYILYVKHFYNTFVISSEIKLLGEKNKMLDKVIFQQKTVTIDGEHVIFNVNKHDQILDKGSYFGEKIFVPYFHSLIDYANDELNHIDYDVYMFDLSDEDKLFFEELENCECVNILVDNLGFVYGDCDPQPIEISNIKERFNLCR